MTFSIELIFGEKFEDKSSNESQKTFFSSLAREICVKERHTRAELGSKTGTHYVNDEVHIFGARLFKPLNLHSCAF